MDIIQVETCTLLLLFDFKLADFLKQLESHAIEGPVACCLIQNKIEHAAAECCFNSPNAHTVQFNHDLQLQGVSFDSLIDLFL